MQAYKLDFGTTDRIANNLGIKLDDNRRLKAALLDGLVEASGNGHCGLPESEARKAVEHRIGARREEKDFREFLSKEQGKTIKMVQVASKNCVFERSVYEKERDIAKWCASIAQGVWLSPVCLSGWLAV
jgi:exodeoxyribonuclease V alpha subunit